MAKCFCRRRQHILKESENAFTLVEEFPPLKCFVGVSDLNISCMFHCFFNFFIQIMNEVNMINQKSIKMTVIWSTAVSKILEAAAKEKEHNLHVRAVQENLKVRFIIHASC